ncbi:hypothetical protein GCM10010343_20650 [Streptomyces avidinii]|nr:hypothetical protein GCM10010343_20650 [Streptomyces avidinii]
MKGEARPPAPRAVVSCPPIARTENRSMTSAAASGNNPAPSPESGPPGMPGEGPATLT